MSRAILANVDRFKEMGRGLQGTNSWGDSSFLIIAIGLIIVFWVVLYHWDSLRGRASRKEGNPKSLFLDLCDAHQLTRAERALLFKAVGTANSGQPALVFVDSRILGRLATQRSTEADTYARLAAKLFGEPGKGPTVATSAV